MSDLNVLLKMSCGDLVIGEINLEMSDLVRERDKVEVVCINHPVQIGLNNQGDAVLRRWNLFSKVNVVMIPPSSIVYTDVPSDLLVKRYKELLNEQSKADNASGLEPGSTIH